MVKQLLHLGTVWFLAGGGRNQALAFSSLSGFISAVRRTATTTTTTTTLLPLSAQWTTSSSQQRDLLDADASPTPTNPPSPLSQIRPLQQQWWPVAALSSLDPTRPNEIRLLGLPLVAYCYASQHGKNATAATASCWAVLDDRCSHRFAPLSEGRVVDAPLGDEDHGCNGGRRRNLQCAYHGWEFREDGTCARVPQQPDSTQKARTVARYPTQVRAGLLWVWADPSSDEEVYNSVPLPINPLLDRWVEKFGPESVFQRDLPYGIEILGENLLDLSHLPYAHHSVGGLKRDLGQELPTRMLSQREKEEYALWEQSEQSTLTVASSENNHSAAVPTLQAEILQAAQHDPIFKSFLRRSKKVPDNASDWQTTVGFWSPQHVRYRRTRGSPNTAFHVELFLCPRSEGRSRVFLFNTAAALLGDPSKLPVKDRLSAWLLTRLFDPTKARGHLVGHAIFDGDGIFLHKQGNRMRHANATYRDYSTPSSADVLLNAYRRWMDRLADVTVKAASPETAARSRAIAQAAVGTGAYGGDLERSVMLDRYNTHTKFCTTCRTALKAARRTKALWNAARTALLGAAGASAVAWTLVLVAGPAAVPGSSARCLASWARLLAAWTALGAYLAGRSIDAADRRIQQFLFEDYVHAEKN